MARNEDEKEPFQRRVLLQSLGLVGVNQLFIGSSVGSPGQGSPRGGRSNNGNSNGGQVYEGPRLPGLNQILGDDLAPDNIFNSNETIFEALSFELSEEEEIRHTISPASQRSRNTERFTEEEILFLKQRGMEPEADKINHWYRLTNGNSIFRIDGVASGNSTSLEVHHSDDSILLKLITPHEEVNEEFELNENSSNSDWFRLSSIISDGLMLFQLYKNGSFIGTMRYRTNAGWGRRISGIISIKPISGRVDSLPLTVGPTNFEELEEGGFQNIEFEESNGESSIEIQYSSGESYDLRAIIEDGDFYATDGNNSYFSQVNQELLEDIRGNINIINMPVEVN